MVQESQYHQADLHIRHLEDKEKQMVILPFKCYLPCPRGRGAVRGVVLHL